jgi:hypothetical protein
LRFAKVDDALELSNPTPVAAPAAALA